MRIRILMSGLATLVLSACMTLSGRLLERPPGFAVPDALAVRECGSLGEFETQVDNEKAWLAANGGVTHRPNLGDTFCDVLVRLGLPRGIDEIESVGSGYTAILSYRNIDPHRLRGSSAFHFVWLRPDEDGRLLVTDVAW